MVFLNLLELWKNAPALPVNQTVHLIGLVSETASLFDVLGLGQGLKPRYAFPTVNCTPDHFSVWDIELVPTPVYRLINSKWVCCVLSHVLLGEEWLLELPSKAHPMSWFQISWRRRRCPMSVLIVLLTLVVSYCPAQDRLDKIESTALLLFNQQTFILLGLE